VRRGIAISLLALAVGLVAAGCGHGSGGGTGTTTTTTSTTTTTTTTTTTLTKSEFAAKISKICTDGEKKIASVGANLTSVSQLKNVGDKIVSLENDQIDQFKAIQPPSEIQSLVDDFISKAETSRDKLKDLVDAAKKSDTARMATLVPEVSSSGTAVRNAATTFGATC